MRDDVSDNSVVLRFGDGEYTYPVIDSTVGDKGFDIGKLRAQTGLVTLDSGYGNTAAYKSAITYLDGEQGILRYRGYPIEQLAERSTFLEVAYLLINGELPNIDELSTFKNEITQHTLLHEDVKNFYRGFPRDAHPMAMLSSVVSALSTFTRTATTRSTRSSATSPPSGFSPSFRRSRPTRTRSRSVTPSCTRATTSATSRTSCA